MQRMSRGIMVKKNDIDKEDVLFSPIDLLLFLRIPVLAGRPWLRLICSLHTHEAAQSPLLTKQVRFTSGLMVEYFWRHIWAHLFLNDENVVSARRGWFISPPFCYSLSSSTYQKVVQIKQNISSYGFMITVPPSLP